MHALDQGYAVEQNVLPRAKCEAIIEALSCSTVRRSRAGARHLMANLAVAELALDSRLVAIACNALMSNAFPFRATLFEKFGQANWLIRGTRTPRYLWHPSSTHPDGAHGLTRAELIMPMPRLGRYRVLLLYGSILIPRRPTMGHYALFHTRTLLEFLPMMA